MAMKIFVAAAGVILIGLINWYFLFSRKKA
jgi:plastocyanin domain-containing protein